MTTWSPDHTQKVTPVTVTETVGHKGTVSVENESCGKGKPRMTISLLDYYTEDKETIHECSPPRDNNVTIHQQTHGPGFINFHRHRQS